MNLDDLEKYRALVSAEQRDLLAQILPEQGSLTLPQADAWLEAAFFAGQERDAEHLGWVDRLVERAAMIDEFGEYPEVIAQPWWELIRLESLMAAGQDDPAVLSTTEIEKRLMELSRQIQDFTDREPAGSWIENELHRLAGKTLAALVRLRLGMGGGDGGALLSPAAAWLARWEFAYLGGLVAWQSKDYAGQNPSRAAAEANLLEALRENPKSTSVRYALAVFIASQNHSNRGQGIGTGSGNPEGGASPAEYALELLSSCLPTYPVRVGRAGLLARLGRYPEAEAELNSGETLVCEGMRYLWPRTLEHVRRQEALLKAALAERAGDSSQAMLLWRKAFNDDGHGSPVASGGLVESRQAFSAWVELERLPHEENAWRKRVVRQRLEKGRQELLKMSAVTNPDVLFFRSVVFLDVDPKLAVRDVRMLLLRRPWIEKELKVGGGRILWLADAALKLGQFELARRAYDLVEKARAQEAGYSEGGLQRLVAKRQALASLFQAIASDDLKGETAPESLDRAFTAAVDAWAERGASAAPCGASAAPCGASITPCSKELCLMAAIGSILCGGQNIEAYLAKARQSGVEDDVCQALDSLASGRISPTLSIESLQLFPEAVRPLLVFCCGQASEEDRIRVFFDWAGKSWSSLAPVDPRRIAAQVVLDFAKKQQYDQALSWVRDNLGSGTTGDGEWVSDLDARIRLHQALWLGRQGELAEAETILGRLEKERAERIDMELFIKRNGSDWRTGKRFGEQQAVLNNAIFDIEIRRGTHDLNDVLLAAVKSQSAGVESTHFLSALGKLAGGQTQRDLFQIGVTPEQWESGLAECVEEKATGLPPERLLKSSLHPSALATLEKAAAICEEYKLARITEPVLLLSALFNITPSARELFASAEIDIEAWCARLEDIIRPIERLDLYLPDGAEQAQLRLNQDVFSPSGRKVLDLMRSEAEAMGYDVCDPRHLLLGLVLREGGATQYGLHHQGVLPKKVQEAVTLSLLARAKRIRSSIVLDQSHIQPIARQILDASAEVASRAHLTQIAEPHLLRGFLAVESLARRILEDESVKLHPLLEIAENYEIGEEVEDKDTIADVESVRQNLKNRLVGQDDAVERILPYIQRMRFGFSVPGKPIGVFLFCGQSGSGKTEMAKELARSVYGSEENLIFLEMGQFNAPESMNIFVGAPPGYIGYGEGKLTNGLRDKPRICRFI